MPTQKLHQILLDKIVATDVIDTATEVAIPPLVAGDRLTRDEFERRYEAMHDVNKAELIEGVVYMPSPVSPRKHGTPHADFMSWLGHYRAYTPGVEPADNSTLRLDWDNEPQPDAFLRILPECGGQTRDEGDYISGRPELVAEISASTESYDLHDKKEAYRRNGVCEYLVSRVNDRAVGWFCLRGGAYESLAVADDGIHRGNVFPGLWLDTQALLNGDLLRVLEIVGKGVKSNEHDGFVRRLGAAKQT